MDEDEDDDDAWLQHYGMTAEDISDTLARQFKRFSTYRQEIWNWHRDAAGAVTEKTTSNNLRVFLLFGGFLSKVYVHRAHHSDGLNSPRSINLSIFGSKDMEQYAMAFLQYLHGARQLAFSTIANYLNALVVLCKFYFTTEPLADMSFGSDRVDSEFVLAGLRRLRAQTNAKAKVETLHKPLHPEWISWPECQETRQRCMDALLWGRKDEKNTPKTEQLDKSVLKSLVCLLFYTIAPPPRSGYFFSCLPDFDYRCLLWCVDVCMYMATCDVRIAVAQVFNCATVAMANHVGQTIQGFVSLCDGFALASGCSSLSAQDC